MSDTIRIQPSHDAIRILAVVVLFKMAPDESPAFTTLMASFNRLECEQDSVKVLLYDNTPDPRNPGPLPPNVRYEPAGRNAGLAIAYNRALNMAAAIGSSWLLLLDQDTALPPDFLATLLAQIKNHCSNVEVAALVPIIHDRGVISPMKVGPLGLRPLPKGNLGIQNTEIMSINSGAAIRCQFLISIGGFNCNYWLDFLDHWLFRRIYAEGKRAAVFDSVLEHSLSLRDRHHNIGIARYRSIVCGESAFITTYRPKIQIPCYLLRLLCRAGRKTLRGQFDLALFTIAIAKRIVLHPNRSLEGTYDGGKV